jgi:hypothetical protein
MHEGQKYWYGRRACEREGKKITHRLRLADLAQARDTRIGGAKLLGRAAQRRLIANQVSVAVVHGKAEAALGGRVQVGHAGTDVGARKAIGNLDELELGRRAQRSGARCM